MTGTGDGDNAVSQSIALMNTNGMTRRRFLLLWQRGATSDGVGFPEAVAEVDVLPKTVRQRLQPLPPLGDRAAGEIDKPEWILRPPGALAESQFEPMCERCGRCAEACPAGAVVPLSGGKNAGTPHIDPDQSPCVLCTDVKCTQVCPSGALQRIEKPHQVRIGVAQITTERCTAWRGLPCRICFDLCPIPGVLVLERISHGYVPVAGSVACTGCGICQHNCPADSAMRIVPVADSLEGRVQVMTASLADGSHVTQF